MKQILLLPFLFIFMKMSFSQNIEGKVIDKEKNPIAYATIQIANKGVLSNEECVFSINIKDFKPTDSVKISYLGFKPLKLIVKEFIAKKYILDEDINNLSEIIISNKVYSLEEILEKVKNRIDSNYAKKPRKQQVFRRSTNYNKFKRFDFELKKATLLSKKALKEVNKSLNEFVQDNLNKSSKNYLENLTELWFSNKKTKLKVIKATRLVNKDLDKSSEKLFGKIMSVVAKHLEKGATYKVKSGILPITDSLKINDNLNDLIYKDSLKVANLKNELSAKINFFNMSAIKNYDFINKTKNYNYTLKGTAVFNDEKIYIINFKPKKSAAKFIGTIYINAYDFAMTKATYEFAKGKSITKNYKLLLGIKFAQSKNKVSVYFQKNKMGLYSLKNFKQETASYVYINRSFKFTKNRMDKSEDKKMIKMEFLIEMDNRDKNELFFIDENEITKSDFKNFKEQKKYKVHYTPKYNPEIWKDYNVLSPVKELIEYDTGK